MPREAREARADSRKRGDGVGVGGFGFFAVEFGDAGAAAETWAVAGSGISSRRMPSVTRPQRCSRRHRPHSGLAGEAMDDGELVGILGGELVEMLAVDHVAPGFVAIDKDVLRLGRWARQNLMML